MMAALLHCISGVDRMSLLLCHVCVVVNVCLSEGQVAGLIEMHLMFFGLNFISNISLPSQFITCQCHSVAPHQVALQWNWGDVWFQFVF